MILQIGAFFSTLLSGAARGVTQIVQQAAPTLLGIGQQFLTREINRKLQTSNRRQVQARSLEVLNTPGISVSRLGGTLQPVGGRVQRSTFTPAALTPAQNPIGNIPLLPVGFRDVLRGAGQMAGPSRGLGFPAPMFGGRLHTPPVQPLLGGGIRMPSGLALTAGARGEPRFARDEFGKTIMFVPSPRPGEGFLSLQQARQLGLSPTRPFWRFNRIEGQFEKIKPRRLNPFNFRATARAGRRVERTLDAVKELVKIERRMTTGKIRLKKRKKRK